MRFNVSKYEYQFMGDMKNKCIDCKYLFVLLHSDRIQ